jgi:hypothetical protein
MHVQKQHSLYKFLYRYNFCTCVWGERVRGLFENLRLYCTASYPVCCFPTSMIHVSSFGLKQRSTQSRGTFRLLSSMHVGDDRFALIFSLIVFRCHTNRIFPLLYVLKHAHVLGGKETYSYYDTLHYALVPL